MALILIKFNTLDLVNFSAKLLFQLITEPSRIRTSQVDRRAQVLSAGNPAKRCGPSDLNIAHLVSLDLSISAHPGHDGSKKERSR